MFIYVEFSFLFVALRIASLSLEFDGSADECTASGK
jgi:hypothetical protein